MFVLFLAIAGFFFYTRERNWAAGFFFGLAASTKAFPGFFLIYFLLRKQWKIAGTFLLWAVGFTLSPVLFYGIERFCNLMIEWLSISFSKPLIVGYHSFANQSLYAFWERLLAHQLHITQPASIIIKSAYYSSIIAICIGVFSSILRFPHKKSSISGFIEFSAICIMMMLFPPIAWGHYWVMLLPATASVYYCLKKMPLVFTTAVKSLFITYIVLTGIPYIFSKSAIAVFFKMHSSSTLSGLVLLVTLIILHKNINFAAARDPGLHSESV
jgi:alpha-1,2-mannosyltransferase